MPFKPSMKLGSFFHREGRRLPGRVPQEMLVCDLGPVLDLSSGGMRVLGTRRRQGELDLTLWGEDLKLALRARVAWSRRLGFRRHEIGLALLEVDETVAELLSRVSRTTGPAGSSDASLGGGAAPP